MRTSRIHSGLAAAFTVLLAWCVVSAAQVDITSYDIRVSLEAELRTLFGTQQTTYVNNTGHELKEVLFTLIGNWASESNPFLHPALLDEQYVAGFDPTSTRIHSVTDGDGNPLPHRLEPLSPTLQTYSLDEGFLVVELPARLAPGQQTFIEIEFETKFSAALLLDNCVYRDTYVWRFGWSPIAVSPTSREAEFVLPAAEYHVEITVPDNFVVLGGADRQTLVGSVAGLKTIALDNDRPRRSVPLLFGPDLGVVSAEWNGVEIHAVYLPGGETFARLSLSYTAEILDNYSRHYGSFGYRRLVIAENPSPGLYGLGADGMVLYGTDFPQLKDMPALGTYDRLVEYLLAHELAHLWWGIGIGVDFNAENWVSEGFAEFLSFSYFEGKYGAFEPNLLVHLGGGLVEDVLRDTLGYLNLRQHFAESRYLDLLRNGFDEAIVKPLAEVEYLNGQTIRIYSKGYLVLRALEARVGEQLMESILREARDAWFGRTLSVDVFQRLAEQITGSDLTSFFDDWVYGDAELDIAVDGFDSAEAESGYRTTVHLRRHGSALPVVIEVTTADGTSARKLWHAASQEGALVFVTEGPVVRVHADPGEVLPDRNRFNNHWPRRILIDHPFRSADAPPIGQPLDAYVLTVSPMSISGAFRGDHQWNVAALPHINPDIEPAFAGIEQMLKRWDIAATFGAYVHRSLSLSALASVAALDWADRSGQVDVSFTAHTASFTHPETGLAGTFWYPTYRLDVTVGAIGPLLQPIPYLSLLLARSDLLTLYMDHALTLLAGIPGFSAPPFATVEWTGRKRLRLAPLFYVDIEASAGTALLDALPNEFLFSLKSMHAFPYPPTGHHRLHGRIELVFPPFVRDLGYAVLNLTRLDGVTGSVFVQGGRIWGGCDRVCESGIRVEYGGRLTIRLAGLLGAPMEFSIGYAQPLIGPDGEGRAFVELGTDG